MVHDLLHFLFLIPPPAPKVGKTSFEGCPLLSTLYFYDLPHSSLSHFITRNIFRTSITPSPVQYFNGAGTGTHKVLSAKEYRPEISKFPWKSLQEVSRRQLNKQLKWKIPSLKSIFRMTMMPQIKDLYFMVGDLAPSS